MSEIPCELIFREILPRVPAESLLRFRCVCKSWRDTIDDRPFVNSHLHSQLLKIQDSSNGFGQLILRGEFCTRLYSLSLDSLLIDPNGTVVNAIPLKLNPLKTYGDTNLLTDSCNGVMLISGPSKLGSVFLWNSITGDSHKLPPFRYSCVFRNKSVGIFHSVTGFGYDSFTDDYKVVRIAQVFDPRFKTLKSETLVYSLKLDSWRKINDFPYRISRLKGGVFLNGALHWISNTLLQVRCVDDLIIAIDLGTENYRVLPLPYHFSGLEKPAKHLGVLDGCLIMSCYYQIERLDIWLMNDYGVENSWIKLFSIAQSDNIGAVETLRPVIYSKSKRKVILQHDKKEFLLFDLETHSSTRVMIRGGPATFSSQICLSSLVRLGASGGGRGGSSSSN